LKVLFFSSGKVTCILHTPLSMVCFCNLRSQLLRVVYSKALNRSTVSVKANTLSFGAKLIV
jgi:hypothetical protein